MGKPAARVGDLTAHGGTITGPGCPTVLIGGMPAAQIGNMHVCPMVTPGVPPIPHVGGPIVGPVPPTVLIGGMPAACVGDMCICVGPPSTILPPGCLTVLIGQACGGMGGGGGGGPGASAAPATTPSSVSSVKGIQTQGSQGQSQSSQQQQQQSQQQQQQATQKSKPPFTLKDIVDILKQIESSEGYEAARFFAGHLDYGALTSMAMSGEPDNDPNQMPTRFMLLFGADDAKLQVIDEHPDNFPNQPKHPINIANLRKALRLLGYDVKETGPYDKQVYVAHLQYIATTMSGGFKRGVTKHTVTEHEDLGAIARMYLMPSWKYLYEKNKKTIGDNPDLLKPGTVLDIPQMDGSSGEKKIEAKGEDPGQYTRGMIYRYPWVPFSLSLVDEFGSPLVEQDDKGQARKEYSSPIKLKIVAKRKNLLIAEVTVRTHDETEILIPDGQEIEIAREHTGSAGPSIRELVRILKEVESKEGYEAARHFAAYLNYAEVSNLARAGTPENDPNQMPTRFMLLCGMDDTKLSSADNHPDVPSGAPPHTMNVRNLQKALKLLGYDVDVSGTFDDAVYREFVKYLVSVCLRQTDVGKHYTLEGDETIGDVAERFGLPSWKYLYQINKAVIGPDPHKLKRGVVLEIPQWDATSGDEKVAAAGFDVTKITGGLRHHYPWVPFSLVLTDGNGRAMSAFPKPTEVVISDKRSKNILFSGQVSTMSQLPALLPDSDDINIGVKGLSFRIGDTEHTHPEEE